MTAMSRRFLITKTLPGAAVAIAGIGTIAWTVTPDVAEAVPLAVSRGVPLKVEDLVEKAQVIVVPRRHRRRRWVCWWRRGRRVCGWRWV